LENLKGRDPSGYLGMVNIKMDLKRIWYEGVNWAHVAQDRIQWQAFVITVIKLRVP
jgi:hypothetical protein